MARVLKFGDVFLYDNQEYVFLGFSGEHKILYSAKILDEELTRQIIRQDQAMQSKPGFRNSPLCCFVVLTTAQFENRMAHFAKTENSQITVHGYVCRLSDNDAGAIKKELLDGPVPALLKEIIQLTT